MLILYKIFSFLFAICILVLVHEYGHYLAACYFKVKVLRFSIGFGKPFYKWRNKKNQTEFCIAPILLGGYVKMLDSREGKVDPADLIYTFDHKPILQRAAIIAAGPFTNVIFALLAFWLVFVIGIKIPKPIIESVEPNSIASTAGLRGNEEIVSIDKYSTNNWKDVLLAMLARVGDKDVMYVKTQISPIEPVKTYSLDLAKWKIDQLQPNPLEDFGLVPYSPDAPPIIDKIAPDSPAAKSGLQIHDKILTINDKKMIGWNSIIRYIRKHPETKLNLKIDRENKIISISLVSGWKYGNGWKKIGYLGISSLPVKWPEQMLRLEKYSVIYALWPSWQEAFSLLRLNGIVLEKLLTGKISLKILGGPISIYQASTQALEQGGVMFISFLALISLTLALLNLLPLPGLDGGFFIFLLIEAIIRRPISLNVQILILRLGMILLLMLFLQATINDLMRMF